MNELKCCVLTPFKIHLIPTSQINQKWKCFLPEDYCYEVSSVA